MGPMLIWPNITIVVNIAPQDVLATMSVRHTVSSKRVTVQIKM